MSLRREMDDAAASSKLQPPGTLKEYSLWLNNFQAQDYNTELELPGWSINIFVGTMLSSEFTRQ